MALPADAPSNVNFTQFGNSHLPAWRELIRKNAIAAEIMMFFIEHMAKDTNAIIVSYNTMMELTGKSRPSISRAIKVLKDNNWVEVVQVGSTHAYAVNERVAWRNHASKRKYAYFSASVIAASSEQREIKTTKLRKLPVAG